MLGLPRLVGQALQTDGTVKEIAKTLVNAKSMLYVGRGINYPVALEGALKMKELAYIHADGYPAGEIKHGPIALVEDGVPVVFLATIDSLHEKIHSNIEEVKAQGRKNHFGHGFTRCLPRQSGRHDRGAVDWSRAFLLSPLYRCSSSLIMSPCLKAAMSTAEKFVQKRNNR